MILCFMQIVTFWDNLDKMPNPICYGENKKKYFNISATEIFNQHASIQGNYVICGGL